MNYNSYGQPQNLNQWGRGYAQQAQPIAQSQPQKFTQSMLTQAAAAAPVAQAPQNPAVNQPTPVSPQAPGPAQQQTPPPAPPPPPPLQSGKINWNTIRPKAYDGTMTGGGGTWGNAITRRLSQNNAVPNQ